MTTGPWYKCNGDLYRCELCKHGPMCKWLARGTCGYAHKLKELVAPKETERTYDKVWGDGVHRWYGQTLPRKAVELFHKYFVIECPNDIPMWSHGLKWYLMTYTAVGNDMLMEHDAFPTDFGIEQDFLYVLRNRKGGKRPFQYMPELWKRIEWRRVHKEKALMATCGTLYGADAYRGIVSRGCWWLTKDDVAAVPVVCSLPKQGAPTVAVASVVSSLSLKSIPAEVSSSVEYWDTVANGHEVSAPMEVSSSVEYLDTVTDGHEVAVPNTRSVLGVLYKRIAASLDQTGYSSSDWDGYWHE